MSFLYKVTKPYFGLVKISDRYFSPVLDFAIRLFMANVFFKSGWEKYQSYVNGDWDTTLFLFEEEHPVPYLDPNTAAVLGTGAELVLPVMLALGLFGRFAAAGLLVMTMIIEFAIPYPHESHYFYMLLLAVPLIKGSGVLSADFLLKKYVLKKSA